ncbi:hypothetical protein ABZ372_30240, partial [Streptomyces sp. NPDC005921]
TVGQQVSAEGQFTWTDGQEGDLFVRNMVFLIQGRHEQKAGTSTIPSSAGLCSGSGWARIAPGSRCDC